jgi:hypothetical protein
MKLPNVPEILDKKTERRIKIFPHPNNRASEAGHPCERFLVLSRLKNESRAIHDLSLQRIFDEGNLHERAVITAMIEAGLNVSELQRSYEWRKFQLSGHIDGKLDGHPFDVKSCSQNVFHAIKNLESQDMLKSKYSWIRNYPAQILLYMMMEGVESGMIIFKNKTTGEMAQKDFYLNDWALEYLETILKKLERVNEHVKNETIPEKQYIDDCSRCPFSKTECFMNRDYGPGFEFLSDEEIEAKLKRYEEIAEIAQEYSKLDREIKEQFKGRTAIIGDWMIESKEYERKNYTIPDEIKNQYIEMSKYFRTSIKKL